MKSNHNDLQNAYDFIKNSCKKSLKSKIVGDSILNLAILSLQFLESECDLVELGSLVPGKKYFSYKKNGIIARPANTLLFLNKIQSVSNLWKKWYSTGLKQSNIASLLYTVALAPCLAMELFDRQNKKGPATYFECLIGHIFAKTLGIDPKKQVSIPIQGKNVRLTMDFLFDLEKSNIHLPVKMSTRERVVQAWAHQRILDSAFGEGFYRGVMVLFSETKLDSRSFEVVEICVPDQWLAYQTLLSKFEKIYYFDIPERYKKLTNTFPDIIKIQQFDEFFSQKELFV